MVTILQIFGALGLFLFGMKVMSDGVQKFAGARMRAALASITGNRFKGVLTGAVTTGLVQSSSATTVLVVSFVNAGLLTLVESIGVIMGANLGTTLTAWIIAAVGKFSIAKIALPIIGVGFPLSFMGKGKVKSFGEFILGFGILFLGLGALKEAVPDLKSGVKEDESTIAAIRYWIDLLSNKGYLSYVLFMVAGIILTLLVQSSSAAMAITITCVTNGWFGDDGLEAFRISAAVVMGENIGTTVTAWLASLGANSEAKRAARAHFLFNVIGTLWMLVVFWIFTLLVWEIAQNLPENIRGAKDEYSGDEAFATAIFHTSFNLINICVLVWFVPVFAKVVTWWVPDAKEKAADGSRLRYIAPRLFELSELNSTEAEIALRKMAAHTNEMFKRYQEFSAASAAELSAGVKQLETMEDESDLMCRDLTEYLIHCVAHESDEETATRITAMIRIVGELEEAADRIFALAKMQEKKVKRGLEFPASSQGGLEKLENLVGRSLNELQRSLMKPTGTGMAGLLRVIEQEAGRIRNTSDHEAVREIHGEDIRAELLCDDLKGQLLAMAGHIERVSEAGDLIAGEED
jgi:phosphate:Na+ symporter